MHCLKGTIKILDLVIKSVNKCEKYAENYKTKKNCRQFEEYLYV